MTFVRPFLEFLGMYVFAGASTIAIVLCGITLASLIITATRN